MTNPASQAPPFGDVLGFYLSARRLRTRATGTIFTVRAGNSVLVVTPTSGIERTITPQEFQDAWPHIEGDEPKHRWQGLSKNTSYLEAIHDELLEELQPTSAATGLTLLSPGDEAVDWEARCRDQRRGFADAYRKLEAELARRTREHEQHARAAADREAALVQRMERIESARQVQEKDRLAIALMEEELDDLRKQVRMKDQFGSSESPRLAGELAAARHALALANAKEVELRSKLEQARTAAPRLDQPPLRDPTHLRLEVRLDVGKVAMTNARRTAAEDARALQSAGGKIFADADATIAECRRVLERCARRLWAQEFPGQQPSARFHELMDGLRSGAIPVTDWHLMKNIYSRASGFVHDGGAKPEMALWIWLGTVQVAELAAESS